MKKYFFLFFIFLLFANNSGAQNDAKILAYGKLMQNAQKEMFCETCKYFWLKNGQHISNFNCDKLIKDSKPAGFYNDNYKNYKSFGTNINNLVELAVDKSYLPYNIENLNESLSELITVSDNFIVNLTNDSTSSEHQSLVNKLNEIKNSTVIKSKSNNIENDAKNTNEIVQNSSDSQPVLSINKDADEKLTEKTGFLKVLFVLLNIIIIIGLVVFYITIIGQAFSEEGNEKIMQILCIVLAILIYFVTKVIFVSLPDLLLSKLVPFNKFSIGIYGLLLPFCIGFLSTWLVRNFIDRDSIVMQRIITIYCTLIALIFTEVYISSFSNKNMLVLLPNISIVIGAIIYLVFTIKRTDTQSDD